MSALAKPQPRGACPGLSAPMPTGDGLLVRFLPMGTISLSAMSGLCAAARTHGNGIIEVTSRGSIQLRGLSARSAPQCAADIAALEIAGEDGIPIHRSPLAGIGGDELLDISAIAAELRLALAKRSLAAQLNPKVSVTIDGSGALGLADLAADIRLRAEINNGEVQFRIGIGGDETTAVDLGAVRTADATAATVRLLDVIACRGRTMRARDILLSEGAAAFHAALSSCPALCRGFAQKAQTHVGDSTGGSYRLTDGSLACGIGLAFGHTDADALEELIDCARAANAQGVRTAPGRTLLAIGVPPDSASDFFAAAGRLDFVVHPGDPRRRVTACAGAPICASAHIASRALAPGIAESLAKAGNASTVHISGCAKGCARAAPANLTIVGTPTGCALIANGTPHDTPFAVVAENALPNAMTDYVRTRAHEAAHA
ncbi:MAG TPA: precorrin-3B synthase [Xanthobacteraceae bacterium]|jgi:precorrin-3B synthase|nr:precorrin-3B synthase [Xanthobacteraceae bacterium]